MKENRITFRAFLLGLFFAGLFAFLTVYRENVPPNSYMTSTQLAVYPYLLLVLFVLAINPLLRFVRIIRTLTPPELLIIFVMGAVSSGISTFGMASQLVPVMTSLFNRHWNNDQSRWNVYTEPYVSENFFIAEPGTQQAAIRFRDADFRWREAKVAFRTARSVQASRQELERVQGQLAEIDRIEDETRRIMKRQSVERERQQAQRILEQTAALWTRYEETYELETMTDAYEQTLEGLEAERETRETELRALETNAFAVIDVFRRGLPEELRAIPGFFYAKGEGLPSYRARVQRLTHGLNALKDLKLAERLIEEAAAADAATLPAEWTEHLQRAVERLDRVADIPEMSARRTDIEAELQAKREILLDEEKNLKILRKARRYAAIADFRGLERDIGKAESEVADINRDIAKLTQELDNSVKPQLKICARVVRTQQALTNIIATAVGAEPADYPELQADLRNVIAGFRTFDASLSRFVVGDIDWGPWIRPLVNWTVLILLTYLVLMTFNVLIFRQWAHNEKLIYPLAELPTFLSGAGDGGTDGDLPAIYKTGLFWAGAAISILVLTWNLLATKQIIPGVGHIQLTAPWAPYIKNSAFEGLLPSAKLHIFFTLIGLSFLVPAKISHSLWLFYVLYMVQILVLCWIGYGVNESSFPIDWSLVLNFRTAEGGGALLVFSSVILWKCRRYLFCGFIPGSISELAVDERVELKVSSWLFVIGSVALIAVLTWGLGANLFYSIFCYLMIIIITIGLVRAVAEGGLLGFQCWFSPFHFIRSVFGMDKVWTAPSFMAPLWIYYSIMFLDIKTFIAPAMANALKVRDNIRMRRLHFHVAVAAGVICACIVAIITHIILSYHRGGDAMNWWFYSQFPGRVFDQIKNMAKTNPVDTIGGKWWMLTGGFAMVALLYFRQRVFWIPHPIGFIMLVNPLMSEYWFSILLGWLFKTMVSKYGNKDTYARFRYLFIGLIVGELVMCLFGVTLNRSSAL